MGPVVFDQEGEKGRAARPLYWLIPLFRPHKVRIAMCLVFALLTVLSQISIPYLTKVAIDRHIVLGARRLTETGQDAVKELFSSDLPIIGDSFVPLEHLRALAVENNGWVHQGIYYYFPLTAAKRDIVDNHRQLFRIAGEYAFIRYRDLESLSSHEVFALRAQDLEGVFRIALALVLVVVISLCAGFLQTYHMEFVGQRVIHALRTKTYGHLLKLPLTFFDRNPIGRLVARVISDTQNIHEMFTALLTTVFKDLFLIVGVMIILVMIDPKLAALCFCFLPFVLFVTLLFGRRIRDIFRGMRRKVAEMTSSLQETISGIGVIQAFCREKETMERFAQLNHEHYVINMRQVKLLGFFVPMIEFLGGVGIGIILWHGGWQITLGKLTIGALVAFLSYVRLLLQPMRDIAEKYNVMQSAVASIERVHEILEQKTEFRSGMTGQRRIKGAITFDNVHFTYEEGEHVLKGVSFHIKEGERVGIVGATGSGKTTMIHLLLGFYRPQRGKVLLDGTPIQSLNGESLRSQVALVLQDPFLFDGTIEQNVRLGDNTVSNEHVESIGHKLRLEQFIADLPNGYQERLKGDGVNLSAGQVQLIAIARAFARDPKVLIFDEAMSALDPSTEGVVAAELERFTCGRTFLLITHRLSTLRFVNRIILLHQGKVREMGTHEELIAKRGIYYHLWRLETFSARSSSNQGSTHAV